MSRTWFQQLSRKVFGSAESRTPIRRPQRSALRIESLEDRTMPAVDLNYLATHLDTYLGTVSASIAQIDPSNPLPVTGSTLTELLAGHNPIDAVRPGLKATIKNSTPGSLKGDLVAFLTQQGLIASPNDVSVTPNNPDPALATKLTIDLHLKQDAASKPTADFTTDFGLGLPAVPLLVTSDNDAAVRLGYEYTHLNFDIQTVNNVSTFTPHALSSRTN